MNLDKIHNKYVIVNRQNWVLSKNNSFTNTITPSTKLFSENDRKTGKLDKVCEGKNWKYCRVDEIEKA